MALILIVFFFGGGDFYQSFWDPDFWLDQYDRCDWRNLNSWSIDHWTWPNLVFEWKSPPNFFYIRQSNPPIWYFYGNLAFSFWDGNVCYSCKRRETSTNRLS